MIKKFTAFVFAFTSGLYAMLATITFFFKQDAGYYVFLACLAAAMYVVNDRVYAFVNALADPRRKHR
jgi:hypothetical protein